MGTDVACVPNVADTGRFATAPAQTPAELAALPKPIVGYVGNVASYKTDIELLAAVGRTRPEWSFALVGPIGSGDPGTRLGELRSLGNVHLLGPKPYKDIPSYIHGFDVCLIPFQRSRVTDSSLPLKTFEYLAAGKPVVATPLPALRAEPLDEVLDYAETAEQFVQAIESCLAEDEDERPAARRETAALYSWDRRFPEIEALVCEVLAHKEQEEIHGGNCQSALEAQ
jgi:glycosyltransferase involved in cell wall biosynthesis